MVRLLIFFFFLLLSKKDFTAATALLEPLATQQPPSSSYELRSALGRVYLQAGQLDQAELHFAAVAAPAGGDSDVVVPETTKALNAAFMASARGEWDEAGKILRGLLEEAQEQQDEAQQDDNANYAVSFFFFFFWQNGIWFSLFFFWRC